MDIPQRAVIKLLCLHGSLQTGSVFRGKLGRLPHKLKSLCNLRFIDAPLTMELRKEDDVEMKTWYFRTNDVIDDRTIDVSLNYLKDVWKTEGPFHGILGFSMGGSMAAILASLPDSFPGLKFVVICAGALINCKYTLSDKQFHIPESIKSLHIIGMRDQIVTCDRSEKLTSYFLNPEILRHEQGHCFPTKPLIYEKCLDFIKFVISPEKVININDSNNLEISFNDSCITSPVSNNNITSKSLINEISICQSLDNHGDQAEELDAVTSIFSGEVTIIYPIPCELSQQCSTFTVLLNPLYSTITIPINWIGNLQLKFILPSSYPYVHPPIIELETGKLTMMDITGSQREGLLSAVRLTASELLGSQSVLACLQTANDWLSEGHWQNVKSKLDTLTNNSNSESNETSNNENIKLSLTNFFKDYANTLLINHDKQITCELSPEALTDAIENAETLLIKEATDKAFHLAALAKNTDDSATSAISTYIHPTDHDVRGGDSSTSATAPESSRGVWNYVIGLVGKPSAGKSTFYNAATKAALEREGRLLAAVAPHPFTTIEPNIGPGWYAGPPDIFPDTEPDTVDRAALHGRGNKGRRLLPIIVKDVAGLVPGAYKGRGKGNKFLSDLCDADVLIHVVDVTGRADRDGNEVVGQEGSSPTEDAKWIREELHRWIHGNVIGKWQSVTRQKTPKLVRERILQLFSGYQTPRSLTEKAIVRSGLDIFTALTWTRDALHLLVANYLCLRFPVCLALNKVDSLPDSQRSIVEQCQLEAADRGEVAVPVSARAENWSILSELRCRRSLEGTVDADTTIAVGKLRNADAKTEAAEDSVLRSVMEKWGGTGVIDALSAAVALKPPVLCYCVSDLDTEAPVGWTPGCILSQDPNLLHQSSPPRLLDCIPLKPGSTVEDVVEALKFGALKHVTVVGAFVRAEGRALKRSSRKIQLGRDAIVDSSVAVLRIQTNRKPIWHGVMI